MNKQYNKHLFFINKGLNWDLIPDERKSEYVLRYVLSKGINIGKVQDWRRYCISNNVTDYSVMLNKAIELRVIA